MKKSLFLALALIPFSALAASEQAEFTFTKDLPLRENNLFKKAEVETIFAGDRGHCSITIETPPLTKPTIKQGRRMILSQAEGTADYSMIDPATKKVIGNIDCRSLLLESKLDLLKEHLGAEPTGGIKKIDINYKLNSQRNGAPESKRWCSRKKTSSSSANCPRLTPTQASAFSS
jgi:hypothetical protein